MIAQAAQCGHSAEQCAHEVHRRLRTKNVPVLADLFLDSLTVRKVERGRGDTEPHVRRTQHDQPKPFTARLEALQMRMTTAATRQLGNPARPSCGGDIARGAALRAA